MKKADFNRLKASVRQMVDIENRIADGEDISNIDGINVIERSMEDKTYILKRDIIIKAGESFVLAPKQTRRFGNGHVEAVIGLTKNSVGFFTYFIDPNDADLGEWFEEIK